MSKVYIEYSDNAYRQLFVDMGFEVVTSPEDAALVCFTGGADVTPGIYGASVHRFTHSDTFRDHREARLFEYLVGKGTPMVGICRGGQFLNVMAGGEMYQHVSGHTAPHEITDLETGEVVYVSSTHHQMMKPNKEGKIIAVSHNTSVREWFETGIARKDTTEQGVEVVFYERVKSLCFQPHPEFRNTEYLSMKRYFATLIDRFLKV